MPVIATFPFWMHLMVELPASINFFFNPSQQLAAPAPQAHAIIRQYAVLLFASNIISLIFALRAVDNTSKNVAAALAIYHLGPAIRAAGRIAGSEDFGGGLGGPIVHLVVHGGCFVALVGFYFWKSGLRGGMK